MSKQMVKFPYERMKNEVHAQFNTTVSDTLTKHDPAKIGIEVLCDKHKKTVSDELIALKALRKSPFTDEIIGADETRDTLFRGTVDSVKAMTKHFDPVKRAAAISIQLLIDQYGNIADRTLDAETTAIDKLLDNLSTGNYPAQLETIGLTEWTVKLREANNAFKALVAIRDAERAARPAITTRMARPATDKAYRAIVFMLDAMAQQSDDEALIALINDLNAIAERYKANLALTGERKKKDEPESTDTPTTPQTQGETQ